jgi:CheY-like chemotaxis protein
MKKDEATYDVIISDINMYIVAIYHGYYGMDGYEILETQTSDSPYVPHNVIRHHEPELEDWTETEISGPYKE